MKGIRGYLLLLVAIGVMAGSAMSASAAMLFAPFGRLILQVSDADVLAGSGVFEVVAEVSPDGNNGLAGLGFSLTGGVTALQHELPNGTVLGSDFGFKGLIGFGSDRSLVQQGDVWNLRAFQPTNNVAATIFDAGKTPGGSLTEHIDTNDMLVGNDGRDAYGFPMVVASGTWDGTLPRFNRDSALTVIQLWTPTSTEGNTGEISLSLADNTDDDLRVELVDVPEPSAIALFGIGGLLMLRRRKGA